MDIIVLIDRFDASLVLLRRKFHWEYKDVFYNIDKSTDINSSTHSLTRQQQKKLLSAEANLGEMLLYEAMNSSWWNQPEVKDESFWREVCYNIDTVFVLII